MDRRTYLRTMAAGGALVLAGCSGGNGDGDTTTRGPTTTSEPPETTDGSTTTEPPETTAEPTPTEPPEPTPTETEEPTATEPTTETTAEPTTETTAEPTTTETTAEPTTTEPTADQVVRVADGGLNFSPESFTVSVGDTVRWVWASSNHNVVPDDVPGGTDWEGSPGGPGDLYNEGYSFEHTFGTPGEYSYYCNPHQSVGMTGSFTVEE